MDLPTVALFPVCIAAPLAVTIYDQCLVVRGDRAALPAQPSWPLWMAAEVRTWTVAQVRTWIVAQVRTWGFRCVHLALIARRECIDLLRTRLSLWMYSCCAFAAFVVFDNIVQFLFAFLWWYPLHPLYTAHIVAFVFSYAGMFSSARKSQYCVLWLLWSYHAGNHVWSTRQFAPREQDAVAQLAVYVLTWATTLGLHSFAREACMPDDVVG